MSDARKWHGSVYRRRQRLWVRYKLDGHWRDKPTIFRPGQEDQARQFLDKIREQILNGEQTMREVGGPVTLSAYAAAWIARRRLILPDQAKGDEARLRLHVLPYLGSLRLDEVRPRDLIALVDRLRAGGAAPRSIHHLYGTARKMYRDALKRGDVDRSPCCLDVHDLGKQRDAKPEWREGACLTRGEAEALISDEAIPESRRFVWAMLLFTGMRHGELAGLRWRHLTLDAKPLGRIVVATSYDKGRTKTSVERRIPIHGALAAVLGEWRLGWAERFGHQPGPDDRVCPSRDGGILDKGTSRRALHRDLATLGARPRRTHDLRRTFVSLSLEDAVDRDVLKLTTHAPAGDMLTLYTSVSWERRCAEMSKLRLARRTDAKILLLPAAREAESLSHSGIAS